ncbi:MAG: RNA polymerase sigma factor [Bryobacteraceae bacterium]
MDRDEFRAAFELHKNAVYRFAWRMTNSPEAAEDVAQEAFLSLWKGGFDTSRGELRGYLFGAARNQVRKRWRDASRWAELDEDAFVVPAVDGFETSEAVEAAVRALPPLQREVLVLSEYEDLSLEEIARAVGAEVGTVKSRLFRARENLRRALSPLREVNHERR